MIRTISNLVIFWFQGNIGHAAVLVYNADSVPEVVNYTFASLTAPRAQSMTLNFTDCSFTGNRLALGSIANFYGNIVLVRTMILQGLIELFYCLF